MYNMYVCSSALQYGYVLNTKAMITRLREFTLQYNAQYDSQNPKTGMYVCVVIYDND